jgi:hypothetical protein
MSKPKGQHIVPRCYLREFIDPFTPAKYEPYVWIFEKGDRKGKKKSPENIFKATDFYTLRVGDDEKNYLVEESLSKLEGQYATIFRRKIKNHLPLNENEHVIFCAFVYAMFHRSKKFKANLESSLDEMLGHIEELEKEHLGDGESETGRKFREFRRNAHGTTMMNNLPEISSILRGMDVAFMCAPKIGARFITSDNPCFLWNSQLQWHRGESPGFLQEGVEVLMPLSPTIALSLNRKEATGYIAVSSLQVEDFNRMTRFNSQEHYVSNTSKTSLIWFSPIPLDFPFFLLFLRKKLKKFFKRSFRRIS